ncbi:hypothetical protein PG996_014521 [Apiospora saccharicola]|uniref:IBR domain-containing protein n=1 Tax=Apiospora saccharicola TaxID=335842 RepID=A0ABR1TIQ6_9PEZI
MSSNNSANRGVVFNPRGGKPARVTKPSATPRRPNRRPNDAVLNQDPSLDPDLTDAPDGLEHHEHHEQSPQDEEHHLVSDEQQLDHHEHHGSHDSHDPHEHHDHHDHHDDFDAETAAAAAAVAAEHHVQQQQQQQQEQQQQQMDLSAAASILTSNGTNPMVDPHEHPDLDQHLAGSEPSMTTEELARDSGYQNVVVESALAKRLSREPGMRLATQRRPEQSLNLQRRSNVEALFAHIAGEMAPVPCKNCHKGHGPWTTCVVVDGQMCGSCANCWFNASGARCSFHETRNPPPAHTNVIAPDGSFQLPAIPSAALAGFNYVSVPSSSDPVVRYTVERAMADLRGADKRARQMLMIEVAAKQLAWNILQFEETQAEEQHQIQEQGQVPVQVDVQGQPQPPSSMLDDQDGP